MNESAVRARGFFITGATLEADAPSYVARPADTQLLEYILGGEYCHVLTPRQMGKSSLVARINSKLEAEGIQTAVIDISYNVDNAALHQWYHSLIRGIWGDLAIQGNPQQWITAQVQANYTPVETFSTFFDQIVLKEVPGKVVVFVDEIDATLSLKFATDDFFAAIRSFKNQRAFDPRYKNLTFILLGTATPNELIKSGQRTPYNLGEAIDLREFTLEDACPLHEKIMEVYPAEGDVLFRRIYDWTAGHPYLTQKLCRALVDDPVRLTAPTDIDDLVERELLSPEKRKQESNLQFVERAIASDPRKEELFRLYGAVLRRPVKSNVVDPLQNKLRVIGLVKDVEGKVYPRNRIYQQVFDQRWVRANLPGNPTRRYLYAALVLLAFVLGYLTPIVLDVSAPWYRSTQEVRIETQKATFRENTSPDVRMAALYQLIQEGAGDLAHQLVFEELSDADRAQFLRTVNLAQVGETTVTPVLDLIYGDVDHRAQLALLANLFATDEFRTQAEQRYNTLSLADRTALLSAVDSRSLDELFTVLNITLHSASADELLVAFAQLLVSEQFRDQVLTLYFDELSLQEQRMIFVEADLATLAAELLVVGKAVYHALPNSQEGNTTLALIAETLRKTALPEAQQFAGILTTWIDGRSAYLRAARQQALDAFTTVLNFDAENSEAYYDRARVYLELQQFDETLTDLDRALALDPEKKEVVKALISANIDLARRFVQQMSRYPALEIFTLDFLVTTSYAVQTLEETNTNVQATFYNTRGEVLCTRDVVLTEGQSLRNDLATGDTCVFGEATIALAANGRIAAVVSVPFINSFGDIYSRRQGFYSGLDRGSPQIFVPVVGIRDARYGYFLITVQNTDVKPIPMRFQVLNRDGNIYPGGDAERTLIAGGREVLSFLWTDAPVAENSNFASALRVPYGWSGAVKIEAAEAALVTGIGGCSGAMCVASEGLVQPSERWLATGLVTTTGVTGAGQVSSTLYMMNTSTVSTTTVTIGALQPTKPITSFVLAPLASARVPVAQLRPALTGTVAAIVASGAPVVASVLYLDQPSDDAALYSAIRQEAGGKRLFFPELSWRPGLTTTVIHLQNLSQQVVTPTMKLQVLVRTPPSPIPPIEVQLPAIPPQHSSAVDVGTYLAAGGISDWAGSAIISGTDRLSGVLIARAPGQWVIAYNAHEDSR